MLYMFLHDPLLLVAAQACVATVMALAVVLVARHYHVHVEHDTVIALLRAIVQIVAVGSVLIVMLQGHQWTSILALAAMLIAAASTAAKRAKEIPRIFWLSLYGIGFGAGIPIILMLITGILDTTMLVLIPVGSMLIANAMTTSGLALNRFQAEIESHEGHIETALALGASPHAIMSPYVEQAVHASLIPRIDSLRSLGIVWIPGMMAGMVLSGEDPVYAAIYQFVVMAALFVVSGLTSIITVLLVRRTAFSAAEQLIIHPRVIGKGK